MYIYIYIYIYFSFLETDKPNPNPRMPAGGAQTSFPSPSPRQPPSRPQPELPAPQRKPAVPVKPTRPAGVPTGAVPIMLTMTGNLKSPTSPPGLRPRLQQQQSSEPVSLPVSPVSTSHIRQCNKMFRSKRYCSRKRWFPSFLCGDYKSPFLIFLASFPGSIKSLNKFLHAVRLSSDSFMLHEKLQTFLQWKV